MTKRETEEQKSFPVRYMVVKARFGGYNVLDTLEVRLDTVCKCGLLEDAHLIARLLNGAEGYRYDL